MELPTYQNDEFLACLAALALYDGNAEISGAQITTLLQATNNTSFAPYWPILFANYLKDKMDSMVFSTGGGGATVAIAAAPAPEAAAAAGGAAPAAKKEEKKKEEEEEIDLGGGMDMFGGGEGGDDY